MVIDTDASLIGWGAVRNTVTAQGSFTPSDVYYAEGNINVLELLAVKYGLQSFASIINNRHNLFVETTQQQYVIYPTWEALTLGSAMQLQKKYGSGP